MWNEKDLGGCAWNELPLTAPKAGLHPKKVMLYIWWDWKGIVYYELLPHNQTINSDKYFPIRPTKGSNRWKASGIGKSEGCRLPIGQRQTSHLVAYPKLVQLGWDVLPHPLYSPDFALSDYHLFRSLHNSFNGKNFDSLEACKNHLEQFIAQKDAKFWENGIMKLP